MPKDTTSTGELAVMIQHGFEEVGTHFEKIETRMDKLEVRMDKLEHGQKSIFEVIRNLPSPKGFERMQTTVADHGVRIAQLEQAAAK